ncbi:MAG: polysaccharide biosynthesis/export family protein [Deltaproteobacteria bacterium]|nr:polysaccharide biosynthesis/export family protein [Deltaproteobacteria bacterium]
MQQSRYASWSSRTLSLIWRAAALFTLPLLWGCGAPITVPPLTPDQVPQLEAAGNYPERNYRIEPEDMLKISYTFHSEMDQEVTVRPDGKITATEVGEIFVSGMTSAELEKFLVERTSDRLRNPEVVVNIPRFAEKTVYVAGEVGKPGLVPYKQALTPLQAIIAAGGFRDTAMSDSVILVRTGVNSEPLARKIDLAAVVTNGVKEPLYLAPHDVVYVPKTPIAEANLWVKQHFTDLIPFFRGTGISAGIP